MRAEVAARSGGQADPAAVEQALASDAAHAELVRQVSLIDDVDSRTKQGTLAKIAVLPAIMFLCYVGLIFYFRSRGGYRAKHIAEGVEAEGERRQPAAAH